MQIVRRIYERSHGAYPIIGCGGISTPDDALAMLEAGATLVQICTEFIYGGGRSLRDIRMGLNERLRKIEMRKAREAEREQPSPENDPNEK